MGTNLSAVERHLSYKITQRYLWPDSDTGERTHLNTSQASLAG